MTHYTTEGENLIKSRKSKKAHQDYFNFIKLLLEENHDLKNKIRKISLKNRSLIFLSTHIKLQFYTDFIYFPQLVSGVLATLTEEFFMNTLIAKHQLIRLPELETLTGLSRSSIYDRLNPKSKRYDSTFPRAIKLSHSSRWRLSEVLNWIESKAALRNQHNLVS